MTLSSVVVQHVVYDAERSISGSFEVALEEDEEVQNNYPSVRLGYNRTDPEFKDCARPTDLRLVEYGDSNGE